MKVSEEAKILIKDILEEMQPLFEECMDHLRRTNPEEFARLLPKATRLGLYSEPSKNLEK